MPVDLGQRLTGARVTDLRRRAKYGVIDTDRGDSLVFHLGMSGHWRIDPAEIGRHDHFIITTDDDRRLALNDAQLNALIAAALAHNPDLRVAEARLRESRAQLQQQRAAELPKVSASAAAVRMREPNLSAFSSSHTCA